MHLQPTAVPSGREAGPLSPVIAGGPWLGEPRDTGAHLCLVLRRTSRRSSGTGPAVGQGGDPGRPLDRLHAAFAAPDERTGRTQMAAAPINRVPGPITATGVRPWRRPESNCQPTRKAAPGRWAAASKPSRPTTPNWPPSGSRPPHRPDAATRSRSATPKFSTTCAAPGGASTNPTARPKPGPRRHDQCPASRSPTRP